MQGVRAFSASASAVAARPLSPHLTIYKFGTNMITSVMFRGTGIVLFGGLAFLAGAQLASSTKLKPTLAKLQEYPLLNAGVKFSVVFPLAYHYAGGLRHVMWDNVKGQSMAVNKQTGLAAVAFATVAGLAASAIEVER